jgi:hypothetical protein
LRHSSRLVSAILEELLAASDPDSRARALARVADSAQPLIDRTLARRCAGWRRDEIADVRSTVLLRLIMRLQRSEAPPIRDLEAFVVVLTTSTVNDFLRRRAPERTRLKNRLRYLCTYGDAFAVWSAAGIVVCGLREWTQSDSAPPPLDRARNEIPPAARDERHAADAVAAVLRWAGRPVALDDLVDLFHELWGYGRRDGVDAERVADSAPTAAATLEQRSALRELWREIERLPRPQRAALLLNLRDADGGNALALIVLVGVAAFADVAAAIGIPSDALAALWERMPLADVEIAAELGLTRQQVINLRKAARRRLQRFVRREW